MMRSSIRMCSGDTHEVCHVATNMPATQVSVYVDGHGSYPASYAVDGSRKTYLSQHSCAHSNWETYPWWTVDLGVPLTITGVLFTNRELQRT